MRKREKKKEREREREREREKITNKTHISGFMLFVRNFIQDCSYPTSRRVRYCSQKIVSSCGRKRGLEGWSGG